MEPAPTDAETVDRLTRVTLVGALVDAALGVGKLFVGQLAGSHALVADGLHSLTDLATDVPVLVVARRARAGPDLRHPYGHGRFETLASLVLGAVLLLIAGGLAQDSLLRLLEGATGVPGWPAIAAALLSIGAKEWVFRYTRHAATELGSPLLLANAWHSRSDALSSVAVLVGVLGAMAGLPWLDIVAAMAVALMIGWVGWELIRDAALELVDTGLPEETLHEVMAVVRTVPGVRGAHHLRSRRMGADVLLDVDVEVDGTLSVSEGHRIATAVRDELIGHFPAVRSVNVHVDPLRGAVEADAERAPRATVTPVSETAGDADDAALPMRQEAEAALRAALVPELAQDLRRLTLHYQEDGIEAELFLREDATVLSDEQTLLTCLRGEGLAWLHALRLWRPHRPGR
ncbi:MAG: cation diffusion facilitator family transporter [Pseudomonadales bacterium]|nr:cation diffusion facilitator family transporter [Pseudomonadales bacterium]